MNHVMMNVFVVVEFSWHMDTKKKELFIRCVVVVQLHDTNLIVCSSAGPKILAFGSHCLANFQPILDCSIPNFKMKYEDSENIKADCVSIVIVNLH